MVILSANCRSMAIVFLAVLSSCAPLTKSQVKMTRNYFETVSAYPSHLRHLNLRIAELSMNSEMLESALESSDSLKVSLVVDAIAKYESELEVPDSIEQHLQFVDSYVQSYFSLIPDGFNAYKAMKSTTQTIGSLVGLGGLIAAALPDLEYNLKRAKRKKIRIHLKQSSKQLNRALTEVNSYLTKHYLPKMEEIEVSSRDHFRMLFTNGPDQLDPLQYYTEYNKLVVDYYQRLFLTRQITLLLRRASVRLIAAEKEVLKRTAEREKINPELIILNEIIGNMQKVRNLSFQAQNQSE